MAKVPVFISFDYDHDAVLKEFVVGQAMLPGSPFQIIDHSIKEASPDWKEKARLRIRRAHQMIVLCGHHTDTATGVNVEIALAREERTPYFLSGWIRRRQVPQADRRSGDRQGLQLDMGQPEGTPRWRTLGGQVLVHERISSEDTGFHQLRLRL